MSSFPKLKDSCSFDAELFKIVNPVKSITSFGNGVFRVNRESKIKGHFDNGNGRKDRKIKMLTNKSLQRLIATVQATDVYFNTMLTLTYPRIYPHNGKAAKKSLNQILTFLRGRGRFEYLWFLEFQERGAPHYHILTNHNGITPRMRVDVAETWVRNMINTDWFIAGTVIESVDTRSCEYDVMIGHVKRAFAVALHRETWQLIREPEGAKRYVTKYASKPEQKIVPKQYRDVGRFWGCSKGVALVSENEQDADEDELKEFLKQQKHPAANMDVLPQFLYNVKHT